VAQADMEWGDALVKQGKRDKAKEKYEKALKNLSENAKHPDPLMINKVKGKLEECK
jgi:predicted negative regulator of RcsB-dependent stress response